MSYNKKAAAHNNSTAWSKPKPAQSLTSDLLGSRSRPTSAQNKTRSKDNSPTPPPSKSKAVRRLERLINSLESGVPPSNAGREGCFCNGECTGFCCLHIIEFQLLITWSIARQHDLSPYTPLCPHCGLVLCVLQAPSLPCPSCHSPILSPAARSALLSRLSAELQNILMKEEALREAARIEQEQREIEARGGGAFPSLGPSQGSGAGRNIHAPPVQQPPEAPRKVISLSGGKKGGRVVVSSFTPAPPPPPKPAGDQVEVDDVYDGKTPVPPPPSEPDSMARTGTERRWEDLRGGGMMYVQPFTSGRGRADGDSEAGSKRRRKGKGKLVAPSVDGDTGPVVSQPASSSL